MPPTRPTAVGHPPTAEPPLPDDATLRAALEDANLPTLIALLAHLTGDDRWLAEPYRPTRPTGLDDHDDGGLPAEAQAVIRDATVDVVRAHAGRPLPPITPRRIVETLAVSVAEPVDPAYGELLAEELGVVPRAVDPPRVDPARDFRVAIIGGGLSGLCAALKLAEAGIAYTLIEKNGAVGGTWWENNYPGCGVDTPSALYSFSFAEKPVWSRYFVQRDELQAHWQQLADDGGVTANTRFEREVTRAVFDEADDRWELTLVAPDGRVEILRADAVITAVGLLNRPAVPEIDGLDGFPGEVLHTAAWDGGADLADKRVTVVGTGASAMQLVPAIVEECAHVTVLQRSPQWAIPHPDYRREVSEAKRLLAAHVPGYTGWYRLRQFWRWADKPHRLTRIDRAWPHPDRSINAANESLRKGLTAYIEAQLDGRPDLVAQCVPGYPPYGKRPLIDNGWYRTLRRDDVTLVSGGVERIEGSTVVCSDGSRHEADVLVLATGFRAVDVLGPMDIRGRDGVRLRDTWGPDDARAHLGITIPGLPNFFCLYGPNTNTGHGGTAVLSTEFQVRYALQLIAALLDGDLATVEVRQDTHDAYNAELDEALADAIWSHPGMTTYYRNSRGRIVTNSPWTYLEYWQRTRHADLSEYDVRPRVAKVPATTS